MIAQLKFRFGRKPVVAKLTDEFTWTCEEKSVETYLNDLKLFPPVEQAQIRKAPSHHLYRLASRLGAQVELSSRTA